MRNKKGGLATFFYAQLILNIMGYGGATIPINILNLKFSAYLLATF
tara:strand:- start:405 stop:542 length:138 start_codon:yes stop_codon:yes gene_type:complete